MAAASLLSRKGIRGSGRYAPRGPETPKARSKYDDVPIQEVWEEYRRGNSEDIRNYLMEKFLPLVRYNAERIHQKLPDEVDIEDLMQAGTFGLKDAVDAFNARLQAKGKLVADYQAAAPAFNARVDKLDADDKAFTTNCRDRKYFQDEYDEIKAGK